MVAVSNKASEAITAASSSTAAFGERERNGLRFDVVRPTALQSMRGTTLRACQSYIVKPSDQEFVRRHMRNLRDEDKTVEICGPQSPMSSATFDEMYLHRVGIILSGGPAPGGHNVVAGVYDAIKEVQPSSEIIGFVQGIDGLMNQQFIELTDEYVDSYRNTGGFDMLFSGRGCVKPEKEQEALQIIKGLHLTGLVIIGGDGTNSNTAAIANLVAGDPDNICSVVGVPKTIDGDLANESIEVSFGFDTASKVYSEQIGSIMADVSATKEGWHFVRIMGRLASHLVLECALQTHPNCVIIAEEVQQKKRTLSDIVAELADCIADRRKRGMNYGVVLVPEGLITFIPEMQNLIVELSELLRGDPSITANSCLSLSPASAKVWQQIPSDIRTQMLDEREASGYIVVAKIATEKFLSRLVKENLAKRDFDLSTFVHNHHYFGYEGRCAIPSVFDAHYTYALGLVAGQLIHHRRNGYLATLRNLADAVADWKPVGVRFLDLLQKVTLPSGPTIAALMRQEVQLKSPVFTALEACREEWKIIDSYRTPGPMQYGPSVSCNSHRNFYVDPPLSMADVAERSVIISSRLSAPVEIPRICTEESVAYEAVASIVSGVDTTLEIKEPVVNVKAEGEGVDTLRVGVCFISGISAGCNNVLHEIAMRPNVSVVGFIGGLTGLMNNSFVHINSLMSEKFRNLGGSELLGAGYWNQHLSVMDIDKICQTCSLHNLDTLMLIGDRFDQIIQISNHFKEQSAVCGVIGIPQSPHETFDSLLGMPLGASTNSAIQNNLIGNAAADASSMPKYYHFMRVDCAMNNSVQIIESAWATRPNIYIVAEEQDSLASVVVKIANCIEKRFENSKKNFGVVLLPTSLWEFIPELKNYIDGTAQQSLAALPRHQFERFIGLFENCDVRDKRRVVPLEQIIAELVGIELSTRASYRGVYQFVTHNLTYQGRGSMPNQLDCNLGATLGAAAVQAARGKQRDCAVSVHRSSAISANEDPAHWLIKLVPFDFIADTLKTDVTMSRYVYKAIDLEKATATEWSLVDRYANPGPIQWN